MKRKIAVITTSRADYGHVYWPLRDLMVGNSRQRIMETAQLALPTMNVGLRRQGRIVEVPSTAPSAENLLMKRHQ